MSESLFSYGKLLARLMGHSIKGTTPLEIPENTDWEKLRKLSDFHNVTSLIYPAVINLNIPNEVKAKFDYDNHRLLAREARQEIESQRVFSALNAAGIPLLKLKGIVIKELYPLPHMRTASDIDICLTKEDRVKARVIMEKLGYTLESSIDYHDEYSMDEFFIYELHSDVISSKSKLYPLFANPFEKAVVHNSNPLQFTLSNEYFYLNLVTHLYKHFISEGCGLRLFCDLYIFRKKCQSLDATVVNNLLEDYGLSDFHDTILQLNSCFFEGNEYSDRLRTLAEFVFRSGEYGSHTLKKLSWLSASKSAKLTFFDKASYFLHNWFPGVRTMKKRYPVLEKAPVLLPVCWIRRIFYTIFFKRSAIKEQKDEIKRLNAKELKEAKRIRSLAGIK